MSLCCTRRCVPMATNGNSPLSHKSTTCCRDELRILAGFPARYVYVGLFDWLDDYADAKSLTTPPGIADETHQFRLA